MKNSLRVSKASLIAISIFLTQFVTLPYLPGYNMIKYIFIVIAGGYVGTRYKSIIKRKYAWINIFSLVFSGILLWTSFQNRNRITNRNPFLAAIVFVALFLICLFFMEIMIEYNKISHILDIFYKTNLVILLINDALILVYPNLYLSFGEKYFIGTKFEVVYLHFLLLCLYIARSKVSYYKNVIVLGMLLWTFFIGIQVKCSTGLVGVVIIIILMIIIKKRENIFLNPIIYGGVQIACFVFVFFCEIILNNSTVQHIIVNILGKNLTMSGRANIYIKVPMLLTSHHTWMTGFGYATSYELGRKLGGFPDTQNGILEWIWYAGIPTTIIMLILFMLILYVSQKVMKVNIVKIRSLLVFLYLLTILGTVEITITQMYFAILVCVMGVGLSYKTEGISQ